MRVLWLPLAQVRATLHCLLAHGAGRVDLDDGAKTVAVRCPVCARTFWRRNPRYQSALSEAFLKPGTQGTTLTVAVLLLVVVAGWLSATRAAAPAGKSRATPVTRRDAPGAPALATTGDLGVPRGLQVPGADSVQDLTPLWYPAEPGDTWVYQRERRDGGIAHSDVARWRTEETIVSKATIPEGVLVFGRVRALDPIPASVVKATPAQMKKELEDSHALIRQGCVYVLDGYAASDLSEGLQALDQNSRLRSPYREGLLNGDIPPDFCFPLAVGRTWGNVPSLSPAEENVWHVVGIDRAAERAFHLSSYLISGTTIDRWFEQGIGIARETILHHGTYTEDRRELLKAIIRGKTHKLSE